MVGFSIKEGICIQRAQSKKYSQRHITITPPLSQFLSDFLISSAKIHLQDSTREISDCSLNVVGWCFHKGGDLHPACSMEKKMQPAPHHNKPPPQSILVQFPHLKRQNPSPRLDKSDQRQWFERRRALFPLRRGFASSARDQTNSAAPHHNLSPPSVNS